MVSHFILGLLQMLHVCDTDHRLLVELSLL